MIEPGPKKLKKLQLEDDKPKPTRILYVEDAEAAESRASRKRPSC